jgi:ribulose-5-phosphate 4-epimerase/fuculose-1-phosphate aldolase
MNRRRFLSVVPAGLLAAAMGSDITPREAQAAAEQTPNAQPIPVTNDERIAELIAANHILADLGVLDGFGHVSVRSATNSKHYFMARSVASAAVAQADILEFDEDSKPVDARSHELYGERFIHGEIYRLRPDVQSVVHSHTAAVLPFGLTEVPLKALIHTAFFLGTEPAPVFDMRKAVGPENHMLVVDTTSGAALARILGDRSVVLMRGHGMAVAAPSIRDAVFRAIYTRENAEVEMEALKLGNPVFMSQFEVTRFDRATRQWNEWVAEAEARRSGR